MLSEITDNTLKEKEREIKIEYSFYFFLLFIFITCIMYFFNIINLVYNLFNYNEINEMPSYWIIVK